MFGFFDPTMLIAIPGLIFAMWAQWKVQHTYQKYSQVPAANGMTGRAMAQSIMTRNGVADVAIEETQGVLSDHYDPRVKKVRLSPHNYREASVASIAVAAHEVGHVLQHAQGYVPLQIRSAIAPVASIGSMAAFPLFFIGFIFGNGSLLWLMDLGILLFTGALVFQIVTLPVEFDASRRAKAVLAQAGIVSTQEEARGVDKVLDAAAMTYVAAAAAGALQLVYLILRANQQRRD